MRSESEAPSVEVFVPGTWRALDLDPATRAASIQRLAEESGQGANGELVEARRRLRARLEQVAEEAAGAGASFGFVFFTVADGKLVSASLIVAVIEATGGVGDGAPAPPPKAIAEGLRSRLGGEVDELAAGPAVRVRRRQAVARTVSDHIGLEHTGAVEIVQWYVPHESGRRLAVLTFSTPNVDLAEQFGELFDAIAGTMRWTA
jgi:hypothetical protein